MQRLKWQNFNSSTPVTCWCSSWNWTSKLRVNFFEGQRIDNCVQEHDRWGFGKFEFLMWFYVGIKPYWIEYLKCIHWWRLHWRFWRELNRLSPLIKGCWCNRTVSLRTPRIYFLGTWPVVRSHFPSPGKNN